MVESEALRTGVAHLERFRNPIEAEVNRRMGRAEPSPEVRAEIIRRFRTFCRLACINLPTAKPSLDGLQGNSSIALEESIRTAVAVAIQCGVQPAVEEQLRVMEKRFRAGLRSAFPEEGVRRPRRNRRRKIPNAGRRVRSAIDRISDAYLALNLDTGKLHDVNPAAEILFATDAQRLLERSLSDLVAPAHQQAARDLEARLEAGQDTEYLDLVFARPNGDFVPVQLAVSTHTIGGKRLAIVVARESQKQAPSALT